MIELERKRTRTMKVFDNGDGTRLYRCRVGREHFWEEGLKRWSEVDTTIINGRVDKSGAQLVIPDHADGSFEWFHQDHNFNVRLLDARHVTSIPTADKYGTMGKGRRYVDAFGAGKHFEIRCRNSALEKLFVIDKPPVNTVEPLTFEMEILAAPSTIEELAADRTKLGNVDIGAAKTYTDRILLFHGQLATSEIHRARAWDSAGQSWPVGIRIYEDGGKRYLQKIIGPEILKRAVYPLYVDDPVRYDPPAGDGEVQASNADWDTVHDATTGTAYPTGNPIQPFVTHGSSTYTIGRAFVPIDTSGIDDGDTVTDAVLNLYPPWLGTNSDNDGNDWVAVVQTDQGSTATLVNDDFNNCGGDPPTEGSNRIDLGDVVAEAYNEFTLTDMSWVIKDSDTMLGIRAGHDALDLAVGNNKSNIFNFRSSEQTGTDEDPYLEVTASAPGGVTATPGVSAVVITAYAPTVDTTANVKAVPGVSASVITGFAPAVTASDHVTAAPGVAAVEITGYAPTVTTTANVVASPGVAAVAITGFAPTVVTTANVTVEPGVSALTLTGLAPTVTTGGNVVAQPGVSAMSFTGYAPTVAATANVTVEPGVSAVAITGLAPTVSVTANVTVSPGLAQLLLTGLQPTVAVSGGPVTATPGLAELLMTGFAPTVTGITLGVRVRVSVGAQDRSMVVDAQSRTIVAGGPTRSKTVFDDNDGTA